MILFDFVRRQQRLLLFTHHPHRGARHCWCCCRRRRTVFKVHTIQILRQQTTQQTTTITDFVTFPASRKESNHHPHQWRWWRILKHAMRWSVGCQKGPETTTISSSPKICKLRESNQSELQRRRKYDNSASKEQSNQVLLDYRDDDVNVCGWEEAEAFLLYFIKEATYCPFFIPFLLTLVIIRCMLILLASHDESWKGIFLCLYLPPAPTDHSLEIIMTIIPVNNSHITLLFLGISGLWCGQVFRVLDVTFDQCICFKWWWSGDE